MTDHAFNHKQNALRVAIESTIDSWSEEWEGSLYDVVGVLEVYMYSLKARVLHDKHDREIEDDDSDGDLNFDQKWGEPE